MSKNFQRVYFCDISPYNMLQKEKNKYGMLVSHLF